MKINQAELALPEMKKKPNLDISHEEFEQFAELFSNLLKTIEKRHRSEAIKRGLEQKKLLEPKPKVTEPIPVPITDIHIDVWQKPPREGLMGFGSCVYNNAIYLNLLSIQYEKELGFYLVYPLKVVDDRRRDVYYICDEKFTKELEDAIIGEYLKKIKQSN